MSTIKSEIKKHEKRVCAWIRKQGVEIKYINGFVVCKELATEELVIFNKLAWGKCLEISYKESEKLRNKQTRNKYSIRK